MTTPDTDRWGIDHRWCDADGAPHLVDDEVIAQLRKRIGDPPASAAMGPVVARRGGRVPDGRAELLLEDGSTTTVTGTFGPDLPYGYHTIAAADGSTRRLILGPGRCHLPADWRAWGWAVQLYATRSRASWGMGDLADLRSLIRWSAEDLGAGFVLVNPLHAVAPTHPQQPSPYSPASRRFRNPIYLAVPDVPGAQDVAQVARAARAGEALNARREIDRDEVWRLKREALEAIWAATSTPESPQCRQWQTEQGEALTQFATYCAAAEQHGSNWRSWPNALQHPTNTAVTEFADRHRDRVRFHAWLQWLTQSQLDAAGHDRVALLQDLPIGVDPNGADAWAWQDLLADDVSIGSPPDKFNTRGQDWGLPPFVPWRLQEADYQPFIEAIRATMPIGGGLRVDHVMGLFRLWWVPGGSDPAGGAFVRYPAEDLLDIVALESHRAGALVVGEDLGTVEPGVREALAERSILSYRLLWFEADEPERWPGNAMAAVTTHDLPTVTGLWDGSDLRTQQELQLAPNEDGTREMRDRLATAADLPEDADTGEVVTAAHRLLARSPAVLLTATLDDAVAEAERPNIPGADGQRPNWSVALPLALEDLMTHPLARRVADTLGNAVS